MAGNQQRSNRAYASPLLERIDAERRAQGMTQEALAERTQELHDKGKVAAPVSFSHLRRCLAGHYDMTTSRAHALMVALGLEVRDAANRTFGAVANSDHDAVRPNTPGLVRRDGPETSKKAAYMATPRTGTVRHRILGAIVRAGDNGLTDDEGERLLAMRRSQSYTPRRRELDQGGFIRDTGRTRTTISGRDATVWEATTSGKRALTPSANSSAG